MNKDNKILFLRALGYTSEEAKEIIDNEKLPEKETQVNTSIRGDEWFFSGDEDDYDDEEYDEEDD